LTRRRLKQESSARRNASRAVTLTQALDYADGRRTAVCFAITLSISNCAAGCLLSLDRLASNTLTMTQELIANMLGVRREGVTDAAGKFRSSGSSNTAGAGSPY